MEEYDETVRVEAGTRTENYIEYLVDVLGKMEQLGLRDYYLIQDNAPIHKDAQIAQIVAAAGHKLVCLPPYSPFLNPIEEFWSKLKYSIKRNPFSNKDLLSNRIEEALETMTISDYQGWIRHSLSFFPRCLAGEEML